MGAEAVGDCDQKVSCCSGVLAFSGPDKAHAKNKDVIDSACDHGAEIMTTPCPVCRMGVEVYKEHINTKCGTDFNIPVVYYSELVSVAYGNAVKEPGLSGQIIRAKKLEQIAKK